MRAELASRPDDSAAQVMRAQADLDANQRAARNLLEALELSGSSQILVGRLRELEDQRREILARLEDARRALDARRGFDPDLAGQSAIDARLQLVKVSPRDRQIALRSIIREIHATHKGGVVLFSLPGLEIDTPVEFSL